jgi:PIN domain nuclease of toxin-antitoxin system
MSMPFLLDTCAALWIMANEPLRPEATNAIDEAAGRGDKLFVSPITGWEIGQQAAKGRFRSSYSPQRWLHLLLARPQIALAELSPLVLLESSLLPGNLNRDPADRIIAATAREYGFTVITRDLAILQYAREGHISALEC